MARESKKEVREAGNAVLARIRRVSLRRGIAGIVILSLGLVFLGFLFFARSVPAPIQISQIERGDAIVVLTGGGNRIRTGVGLLQDGFAKRLLITGVYRYTTEAAIRSRVAASVSLFDCCIDIDRHALDTLGNAEYTAEWVQKWKFGKLIVVTSNYHMPRSLILMQRAMPDVTLIPAPVLPPDLTGKSFANPTVMRAMISEYFKYLAVWIQPMVSANPVTGSTKRLVSN